LPFPAIELPQDLVAVLVALLMVAHHPKILNGEAAEMAGDLLHGQLVVALMGNWADRGLPGRKRAGLLKSWA